MQKIIEDKDLGLIVLRKYLRSRNYTLRLRKGEVRVSLPWNGSFRKAMELVEKHRSSLLQARKEYTPPPQSEYDVALLRKEACDYLPVRLNQLAVQFGFTYHRVRISQSRGRWGSCSSKKNINLSLYLMTLPLHLIDYVILHELCHTKEMNHGPSFWALLDEVTGGKARSLRAELRSIMLR